jgi:putative membrane protein
MLIVMEKRLLRIIMVPALGLSWLTGLALAGIQLAAGLPSGSLWLLIKLLLVVGLSGFQWRLAWHRARLANGQNRHSERYFRVLNEVPSVLLIVIVIMVVVKPF